MHNCLKKLDDISSAKFFHRQNVLVDLHTLEEATKFSAVYFGKTSKSNKKIQKAMAMCLRKNLVHGQETMERFDNYSKVLQANKDRKIFKAIPQYVVMEWL